ncbi:hypothetical protein A2U01_0085769, partial [Trifolium medium]|nr:hypothetical protein [Trifolium medium]
MPGATWTLLLEVKQQEYRAVLKLALEKDPEDKNGFH